MNLTPAIAVSKNAPTLPALRMTREDRDLLCTFLDHEDVCSPLDHTERSALVCRLRDARILENSDAAALTLAGVGDQVTVEDLTAKPRDRFSFKLVMPYEANFEDDRISVLSPLGAAVFGHSVGAEVPMISPSGSRTMRLLAVSKKAVNH